MQHVPFLYALRDFLSTLIDLGAPVVTKTNKGDSVADMLLRKLQRLPRLSNGSIAATGEMLQMLFLCGSELRPLTSVSEEYWDGVDVQQLKYLHRKTAILQRFYGKNKLRGAYNITIASEAALIFFYHRYPAFAT